MARGRPTLPIGEKMVTLSLRIPPHVYEFYKAQGNASAHMRAALEVDIVNRQNYTETEEQTDGSNA